MKQLLPLVALLALPACLGGGDSGVEVTPDVVTCGAMAECLDNVRIANGEFELEHNADVTQAALDHVNHMLANDYLDIAGDFDDGMGGTVRRDGADTAAQVYDVTWNDFIQMIAQGEVSEQDQFNAWLTSGSEGNGNNAIAFQSALNSGEFDIFGFARAGDGDDMRWMLILLDQ